MNRFFVWFLFACTTVRGELGLGVSLSYSALASLQHHLNELNREWGGSSEATVRPPMVGMELFTQTRPAAVSFGAGTVLAYRFLRTDSLGARLVLLVPRFTAGYPVSLAPFTLEPFLDIGLNSRFLLIHSLEPGMSNFNRWLVGWNFSIRPGILTRVQFRVGERTAAAIYIRGGFALPLGIPQYYGTLGGLNLTLAGLTVDSGLILLRTAPRHHRI